MMQEIDGSDGECDDKGDDDDNVGDDNADDEATGINQSINHLKMIAS